LAHPASKLHSTRRERLEEGSDVTPVPGCGGSEWESNPPRTTESPYAGFEDRDDHRTACASVPFCNSKSACLTMGSVLAREASFLGFDKRGAVTGKAMRSLVWLIAVLTIIMTLAHGPSPHGAILALIRLTGNRMASD
jgi:hypothetical protein